MFQCSTILPSPTRTTSIRSMCTSFSVAEIPNSAPRCVPTNDFRVTTLSPSAIWLAAKAGVTRQAASQLIREIEARGYVDLRPDPGDGRAVIVGRTVRGQRLLRDAL